MGMAIDRAIELLSDSANRGVTTFNEDFKDAQKLGIEALKRVKLSRSFNHPELKQLLLGETEEWEVSRET